MEKGKRAFDTNYTSGRTKDNLFPQTADAALRSIKAIETITPAVLAVHPPRTMALGKQSFTVGSRIQLSKGLSSVTSMSPQ